jgi:hypothetical protein
MGKKNFQKAQLFNFTGRNKILIPDKSYGLPALPSEGFSLTNFAT